MADLHTDRKRRRSSSSMSYTSISSDERRPGYRHLEGRRMSRISPSESTFDQRNSSSTLRTPPSSFHREAQTKAVKDAERDKRRKYGSRSPADRGRHRKTDSPRRWKRGSTPMRDRGETTRLRRSETPELPSEPSRHRQESPNGYHGPFEGQGRHSRSHRNHLHESAAKSVSSQDAHRQRHRSLSPFSKRLAMTQAMNSR